MTNFDLQFFTAVAGVVGLSVGSFLNVVVYRLPRIKTARSQDRTYDSCKPRFDLSFPRSHCPACKHQIRWYENIPVLSFLMLRGQCSGCHSRISLRYPCVEVLTGALTALIAWSTGPSWTALALSILCWASITKALLSWDSLSHIRTKEC